VSLQGETESEAGLMPGQPKSMIWQLSTAISTKTMALAKIARALLLQGFQALGPAVARLQRLFKYHFTPISDYRRPLKLGMKQEVF